MQFPWFNDPLELERRKFRMKQVPDSDRWLVTPSADKHEWEEDELNWRSSLLDNQGNEISGGLPKFLNYGEGRNETGEYSKIDKDIARSVQNQTALLTLKEDGSLIIRSVYEGEVIFRTRGSHQLPDVDGSTNFKENVYKIIEEKYPVLLSPKILPTIELYFEYVSPENRIVVPYTDSDLVFIHAKYRETQQLLTWQNLKEIATAYRLNLVSLIDLKTDNPEKLKRQIDELEKQGQWPHEGVVIRTPHGLMAKIKGDAYIAQHRLKSGFNYEKMVEICEENNLRDYLILKQHLQELGLDWESIYELDEMFETYMERRKEYERILQTISEFVHNWKPENEDNVKKQFALQVKDLPNNAVYFYLFNNNEVSEKGSAIEKLFNKIVVEG